MSGGELIVPLSAPPPSDAGFFTALHMSLIWPNSDLPQRPLSGRYWGQTGHDHSEPW
jgi:hypothetical protein